jgi:hypothetical protein
MIILCLQRLADVRLNDPVKESLVPGAEFSLHDSHLGLSGICGQPFPSSQQNNDKEIKITLRPALSTRASISLIVFRSPTIVTVFRSRGCFNTVASTGTFSLAKTKCRVVLMLRVPT